MRNIRNKAEYIPLNFSLLVMWFTLFVFIFGPIQWIQEWGTSEIATVLLLMAYFFAFTLGYLFCSRLIGQQKAERINIAKSVKWHKILGVTIFINLILTIGNALLYSDTTNLSTLLDKAIEGIFSPADNYYSKDATSRSGSIVVWISLFYSPMMYITNILSLYLFKSLSKLHKVCVIVTFTVEIARWLAAGTNKGLFDIVLLFVTYYLILQVLYHGQDKERTRQNKRRMRRIFLIVLIALILFFSFFGTAIADRLKTGYNPANYRSFPYNLVPENLRFLFDKADSYLVQGYSNMNKIIKNCEFNWTFGLGNSRFLMQITNMVLGVDLTPRTYPYLLEAVGVDPLASWHSAYAWFASDLTFVGVIVLMFFAGYYMCSLVKDIIAYADPVSMALFYLMIMMVVNASCTNYVLAYSNGFVGFWALFFIRLLKKKHVRIVLK